MIYVRQLTMVLGDGFTIDYQAVANRRDAVVKRLRNGVVSLLRKNKVEFIEGEAHLVNAHTVSISTRSDNLSADSIVIATGSKAAKIQIQGLIYPGTN